MYTNVKVNISHNQKQKLRKALASGSDLSLRLFHDDEVTSLIARQLQSTLSRQCSFCIITYKFRD